MPSSTSTTPSITKLCEPRYSVPVHNVTAREGALIACGGNYGTPLLLTGDIHELNLYYDPPSRGLYAAHLTEDVFWIAGEYGFVARSEDGGKTWEELNSKCKKSCLYGVMSDAQGNVWLGGADGALAMSKDGRNFKAIKGIEGAVRRMTQSPIGLLIPTAKPGALYIANEGKLEKTSLDVDVYLNEVVYTPQGTLLVSGDSGALYRSTDQGASFEKIDAGHEDVHFETIEVFADGRVVVAGGGGLVLISGDDGQTFEQVEHNLTTESIWSSCAYEEGVILGADKALMIGLDFPVKPARYGSHHFMASGSRSKGEEGYPEHWRSPVLSEASWSWEPEEEPTRVANALYLSPTFMTWLIPRHGGFQTQVRPLPTREDAWGELQRAVWLASATIREERGSSPVWDYIASSDLAFRALGERLMSTTPADLTRADFKELIRHATKQSGRSELPMMMSPENNAKLVDYMVLVLGLEESIKLCFETLYELAYSHTGLFERLRALTSQLDDAAHARAQDITYECYKAKCHELATTSSYVGKGRAGDLRWAGTYMLPFAMGTPTAQQREVHREALSGYLSKFGDSGTHAAGLASGDLDTLKAYLNANSGFAHQFFFPGPALYMASILEREGGEACASIFSNLRPTSPWTTNDRYNRFTCEILAHIKSDETWGELLSRYRSEETRQWGLAGLQIASELDPGRLFAMLEDAKERELADALQAHVEQRSAQGPAHAITITKGGTLSAAHPYSKSPPAPPYTPSSTSPSFAPEPELRFSDEEREAIMDADLSSDAEFEGTPLHACSEEQLEQLVAFYERWRHRVSIDTLLVLPHRYHKRLIQNGFRLGTWDIDYRLNQLVLKHGVEYIDLFLHALEQRENDDLRQNALRYSLPIADARITPHMVELFAKKQHKALAAKWLRRHPEHAVAGILGMLGEDANNNEAIRALLYLDMFGHEELIKRYAAEADCEALVEEILTRDPLTPKLKKKIKLPAYVNPKKLPELVTTRGGAKATDAEVEEFIYRFAFSNEEEPHPELLRARKVYTSESRAKFVWALFQAWLDDGAPAKQQWCLQALGFWGDDQVAHDLAQLAKKWPGEGAAKRAQWALAALANTGLESALIHINLLSEKSKFPAFKEAASGYIALIAEQRKLSREELSDRLAPSLNLDEEGAELLDFGPRQFSIRFDEALVPFVVDGSNKRLKTLPKANASDDPALAKEAHKRFKELKKEAKLSASLHVMRFEMIMASQRAIPVEVFSKFFVQHPWMTHLTQRLVWMTNPEEDASATRRAFRVSVEQTLVDMEEEALTLDGVASVCIAHPIYLSESERKQWLEIFADYELVQPFDQLDRELFILDKSQQSATQLDPPNKGEEAHFRKILALEKRRWRRYEDMGIDGMTRTISKNVHVTLMIEEGWYPYMEAEDIDPQKIDVLKLDAPQGVTFGSIDPAMMSEILRDTVLLTR